MNNKQQEFVLRWHYHDATLMHNLPAFLENELLTDVVLSVGPQKFRAHKIILAMCSAYFFQLFQEINTEQPVIVLHNVSVEDIRAILAFIYKGQCVVTNEHLPNLLSVARLLKIQGLCDMKVPEKQTQHEPIKTENNLSKVPNSISDTLGAEPVRKSCLKNTEKDKKYDNLPALISNHPHPQPKKSPTNKDTSETCKCFLCGKYLSNQYNLRVHMETHEEAFHACKSCPHVSRSRDALRKHVSYRHPEEYHTRKRKKPE